MRRWLLTGLLVSGCVLPSVEIVQSFGDGGSGGSGANGSGGNNANAGSGAEGNPGGQDGGGNSATAGKSGSNAGSSTAAGNDGEGGEGGEPGDFGFENYSVTGSWPEQPVALKTKPGSLTYQKVTLQTKFLAESCAIGDYDHDGNPDVSSGRRWYEGPDFTNAHIFRGGHDELPITGGNTAFDTEISDDWADYAFDMNDDGYADIINISSPDVDSSQTPNPVPKPQLQATAYWYENPGPTLKDPVLWTPHLMYEDVRNEQHGLVDVDGDGLPEIYGACRSCNQSKGFYAGNWSDPTAKWVFHPVTPMVEFPFSGTGWMHGMGFGDVDGDGQTDMLDRRGAWVDIMNPGNTVVCPATSCGLTSTFFYDGDPAANRGGAHMFAFDIDGDGDADVISADWAHGYGLAWYEQTQPYSFVRRQFMGSNSSGDIAKYGSVVFSQPHSMQVADMDGDGVPDMITGKMRYAHPNGYGDPDIDGAPVLYVFKTKRNTPSSANQGSVTFEPHLVDSEVGVGRQFAVGHLNRDGIMDMCIASKLGLYVFLGQ